MIFKTILKTLRTVAVGYFQFPHVWMIRAIGPRGAILLSRVMSWFHWLATFVGAEKRTRRALTQIKSKFDTPESVNTIMRRYLANKLQNHTEWNIYSTARGRKFVKDSYREIEGRQHLDDAIAEDRGVILLVFHYGLARMSFPALDAHGYEVMQHVFRGATYAGSTYDWMATAAMNQLARADRASGLKILYHRPIQAFITLSRSLRRGEIVGMNADGMMSDQFVEVPFFEGTMRLPTGSAQLAGRTGAPVVPLFVESVGMFSHRLTLHPACHVADSSPEAVQAATSQFAAILEQYVRRAPWDWWTWRRLQLEEGADGKTIFDIKALPAKKKRYVQSLGRQPA